jgi:hypothetical protein
LVVDKAPTTVVRRLLYPFPLRGQAEVTVNLERQGAQRLGNQIDGGENVRNR